MRGRTKNLLENIVAFIIFILILFGVYLIIINYTDIGKKLDLLSPQKIVEKVLQKEIKIKELIDEKNFNEEDKNSAFEIKPIIEKTKEIKEEKNTKSKSMLVEVKKEEISKPLEKEVKKELIKKEPEPINSEKKDDIKETDKTEVEISKPKQAVLTDKLIKEKFALINSFLRSTKHKINEKVSELTLIKTDKQRYANIRVTVLEDGSYESLTLMDGDKEYFKLISPAILSIFPIVLDDRILDQFPRYFRMKIIEER